MKSTRKDISPIILRNREKYNNIADEDGWEIVVGYSGYVNNMVVKCPEGHEITVKPQAFMKKRLCRICKFITKNQNKIVDRANEIDWEVNSMYVDHNKTPMNFTCS